MANPIVQFGGLEGDQLQTWMTREEKRLKVLRTAYDQQLKKTKERVAKALEPERARSPPAPPPRRAVSMPKATSLSDGGTTNFLEEERLRKTVEIEKFREYEDRVFAKQERVQANRSKALARTRAQAAQAEVALERARQNQSQASDNREEIRRRYSESMQRFEARAAEQERLRHETLTERQVAVLEKRRRARQNCARIRAEKLKAVLDKAGVRDERYHNYKSTLDGKKEEERRSMLEKMAQKRNHVKQEAEAKRKQEEEHQLEKAMQLKEKEARAQQQMQLMRDKQSERFKEWHEWRAFMSDNVQHTSQEQAIHQEYIAARVKRDLTVAEELEKRKQMLAVQARELHYQQSQLRNDLKALALDNERKIFQQGPLDQFATIPEVKAIKTATLKPIATHPLPDLPEVPPRKKYVKGQPNPYGMEDDY